MIPVTLPQNVSIAPSEVLEMIKCGCTTDTPCSTAMCEYHNLAIFCGCTDCDSGDLSQYSQIRVVLMTQTFLYIDVINTDVVVFDFSPIKTWV
jgi:hypothetical protein